MDVREILIGSQAGERRAGTPPVPELTPQERLQPALLDRLTDEEPRQAARSRESGA